MVKWLIFCLLAPLAAWSQSRHVGPDELILNVTLEEIATQDPYQQEMILLTIHGIYKRHITLETLEMPDLEGINWMQLGQDHWFESMLDGKPVKNMRRRMALFPDRAGPLEIGAFKHHLTLLDEKNVWFEHMIASDPVSFTTVAAPPGDDWWFPVRHLEVTDDWSNAPDQLEPGAGVLRIVRVSALGASPDMIPPMPELRSPSALIFPHPEKRLVDLTPRGPVSIAYWRWTITPQNGISTILEPIAFSYFDTVTRMTQTATISAQRVAFAPDDNAPLQVAAPPPPVRLRPVIALGAALLACLAGLAVSLGRGRTISLTHLRARLDKALLLRRMRRAAGRRDLKALRRAGHALDRHAAPDQTRRALLDDLDRQIFAPDPQDFDPRVLAAALRHTLT